MVPYMPNLKLKSDIEIYAQGRPSRGFWGARAPLLFCPPRGIHTEEQKNCTCFLFTPPRAPLLSRSDGRPCI